MGMHDLKGIHLLYRFKPLGSEKKSGMLLQKLVILREELRLKKRDNLSSLKILAFKHISTLPKNTAESLFLEK